MCMSKIGATKSTTIMFQFSAMIIFYDARLLDESQIQYILLNTSCIYHADGTFNDELYSTLRLYFDLEGSSIRMGLLPPVDDSSLEFVSFRATEVFPRPPAPVYSLTFTPGLCCLGMGVLSSMGGLFWVLATLEKPLPWRWTRPSIYLHSYCASVSWFAYGFIF